MTQRPVLLLVEDDEDLGRLLKAMLRELADVAYTRDGREALEWLESHPAPAAVLTDRAMPRVDGITLARTLRADARWRHIPVVMLTAMGDTKGTVDAINAGVRQYLHKPFKSADLIAKIAKTLREGPRTPPAASGTPTRQSEMPEKDLPSFEIEIDMEGLEELEPSKP